MFLLINKPSGITSHDVIHRLRKITGERRIGHAGTLDPFAIGLLVCAIGRDSTKHLDQLLKLDKTYQATLRLGATSNTYDLTGKITKYHTRFTSVPPLFRGGAPLERSGGVSSINLSHKIIHQTLLSFLGPSLQTPPIYSAKKINGQKAYNLARQNQSFKLPPQPITIHNIQLRKWSKIKNQLSIIVSCSSGTYIRSLASDIGAKLNTGAYLTKLKRTSIGPFHLKDAIKLKKLTPKNWRKFTFTTLPDLPAKTKILAFGTFDRFHPGHEYFIRKARSLGDELHVVVARDNNVQKIKNKRPKESELKRLSEIKNNIHVTSAHLGQSNLDKRYRIIGKIKPGIIALGYDQQIDENKLKAKLKHYNLNTQIIRLSSYHPEKYKSSLISLPPSGEVSPRSGDKGVS